MFLFTEKRTIHIVHTMHVCSRYFSIGERVEGIHRTLTLKLVTLDYQIILGRQQHESVAYSNHLQPRPI